MADNATQNLSTSDGADLMAQLPGEVLAFDDTDEAAPQGQPDEQRQQENTAPEDPGQDDTADPDDSETDDEQEDGDDENEATESEADDKAEATQEEADADPVYEIEDASGETKEVKLSEMAEAYSKVSQIETRAAEIAERQKALETREAELPQKVTEATKQREDELAYQIHQWSQNQQWVQPPDHTMLDQNSPNFDPEQYHYQKAQYEAQQGKAAQAAQQLKGIAEQRQREVEESLTREFATLEEKRPHFKDETAVNEIVGFLKDSYGLSMEEIRGLANHKVWMVFDDAMRGSKMKSELPKVREKVKARPPRPVKPTARTARDTSKTGQVKDKMKRLKTTGRWQDAASIFEDVL